MVHRTISVVSLARADIRTEITLNVVFFYKSNWQNELLRLQRRNKFMCALMVHVTELGIESPHRRWPGQSMNSPMYLHNTMDQGGMKDYRADILDERAREAESEADTRSSGPRFPRSTPSDSIPASILKNEVPGRKESITEHAKRVDFSLGASDITLGDSYGDAFRGESTIPAIQITRIEEARASSERLERSTSRSSRASQDSQGTLRKRERSTSIFGGRSATVQEESEQDLESALPAPVTAHRHAGGAGSVSSRAPQLLHLTHTKSGDD